MNMSYDSSNLTTPDIKWLGVRPSDLDRFNIPQQCRLPMTDEDVKTGKKLVGMRQTRLACASGSCRGSAQSGFSMLACHRLTLHLPLVCILARWTGMATAALLIACRSAPRNHHMSMLLLYRQCLHLPVAKNHIVKAIKCRCCCLCECA